MSLWTRRLKTWQSGRGWFFTPAEEGGTILLVRKPIAPGETLCDAPEGHDYYVALYRPCDHCGAAL